MSAGLPLAWSYDIHGELQSYDVFLVGVVLRQWLQGGCNTDLWDINIIVDIILIQTLFQPMPQQGLYVIMVLFIMLSFSNNDISWEMTELIQNRRGENRLLIIKVTSLMMPRYKGKLRNEIIYLNCLSTYHIVYCISISWLMQWNKTITFHALGNCYLNIIIIQTYQYIFRVWFVGKHWLKKIIG
jgi:hypothetical protein